MQEIMLAVYIYAACQHTCVRRVRTSTADATARLPMIIPASAVAAMAANLPSSLELRVGLVIGEAIEKDISVDNIEKI